MSGDTLVERLRYDADALGGPLTERETRKPVAPDRLLEGAMAGRLLQTANHIEALTAENATLREREAEGRKLLREALPPDAAKVLAEMRTDWGYPFAHLAADTGVLEKRVGQLVRAFNALGWAYRHSFHSEDDNLIRGSGYSRTALGERITAHLDMADAPARSDGGSDD